LILRIAQHFITGAGINASPGKPAKKMNTDRTLAPGIIDPLEFDLNLPSYQLYVLANGVRLYSIDMGEQDTLMISWVFYAGNWFEEKNLVAAATNHLLKNGTTRRSAFDINEHFEYYGSYLSRSCQHETAEITLHCLGKYVKELVPVIAELLTESIFPAEELDIYRRNMRQRLQVSLKKADFVAGRLIDSYLFGTGHPYGKYSSLEEYAALDRQEMLQFYQRNYLQGHCVIFAAGRIPESLPEDLDAAFGRLSLRPHHEILGTLHMPVQPAQEKKYRITHDAQSIQGSIRMGRPFPNRHDPDFQKVQVLNTLFGGFFGSRLMTNIREDKGYTYGIHSYLLNLVEVSALQISTEAGKEVCEDCIREVYAEMKRLRDEPVEEDELHMVRSHLIGSILGDLDGPFQVAGRWKNILLNHLDERYFYQGVEIIKTIGAEELRELAQRYLRPEDFYELVVY
jgi:zinc protease